MAFYSDALIEEVLASNDIVDVIGEYVVLKKSGRNYMGCCPFHKEKTASFCVSADKQIYKCFGCGEGGNVIHFIKKNENIDFKDALEYLAERAHLDLSKFEVQNVNAKPENRELKETLYNLNTLAAKYFHEALCENNPLVKEYLNKRRLDSNIVNKFGIGFGSKKGQSLYEYLVSKGFSEKELLASSLILKNESGKFFERFKTRLIFPIFDTRDRVIGFGGRVLDKSLPKYVNSAENEVYSKGRNLYALNFAKREKTERIVIVEGYMDAVSLHKEGITNVVASLGTALTDEQARLLKKYTDTVVIGYDQDGAGQAATLRGLDILVSKGLNVKVLKLDNPDIKDPDEYINKYGADKLKVCIDKSMSLVEFKIELLSSKYDTSDLDSKIKFLNEIAGILAKINNDIERDVYVDIIADRYKIGRNPILSEISKKQSRSEDIVIDDDENIEENNKSRRRLVSVDKKIQEYVIGLLLLKDKSIFEKITSFIGGDDLDDEIIKKIYRYILDNTDKNSINKFDILLKLEDDEMIKEITEILSIRN